jgi:uncharacterized protein (TIGR03000 family)
MVLMVAMTTGEAVPDCHRRHGCHGCNGCYSGCYGGGCYGGGGHGCHGGGYGYCGGGGCWGGASYGCGGGIIVVPGGKKDGKKEGTKDGKGKTEEEELGTFNGPSPATLVISLPADAKLTVDGYQTQSTSATRRFTTPPLPTGRDFSYALEATVVVDGKTQVISKQVMVRAGEETRATLSLPVTAALAR